MFAITLALLMTGCAFKRNGSVHHVVIGFGVISVPCTNAVAEVTKIKAVGAYAGGGVGPRFALGYVDGTVTSIDASATNVVIEVKP